MPRAYLYAPLLVVVGFLLVVKPGPVAATPITTFTPGDLVISTVSCQVCASGGSGLDTASPITLNEFQLGPGGTTATSVGTLVLPQTVSGANQPVSGEYGSASEGILQRSVDGQYLTIMGYGVNANSFNTASSNYGNAALGQTTSAAGNPGGVTTVPRVVGLIGYNGSINTSTALTGIFNMNNPRSAATVNGSSFYLSGQGNGSTDPNQGVFLANLGATTATSIFTPTNVTKGATNYYDTRVVSIVNNGSGNQLFVSEDINPKGSGGQNFTNVGQLSGPAPGLPTSSSSVTDTHIIPPASPFSSGVNNGSIDLTLATDNGINSTRDPQSPKYKPGNNTFVYLSPEQYFFASPTVLYVTDSGQPKNGNADAAALGEGGLQKWVLVNGTWTLEYDLVNGLGLVNNDAANSAMPTAPGVTGLFGLTGDVVGDMVELFVTTYGLNELSPSELFEITDVLDNTSYMAGDAEMFNPLYSAPAGTSIRGVAFAPQQVPESSSFVLFAGGLLGLWALMLHRRRPSTGPDDTVNWTALVGAILRRESRVDLMSAHGGCCGKTRRRDGLGV